MELTTLIRDIEAEALAAGVSINKLCREAGVNRSTLMRWKNGDFKSCRLDTYSRIRDALDQLKTT